jgi:gamma-glutamylcyclotransferase (GGCT)/AIG2-like uncharacterized protein YtfP
MPQLPQANESMPHPMEWWQRPPHDGVPKAIAFLNSARRQASPAIKCDELCKALNAAAKAFLSHRMSQNELSGQERSDHALGRISSDNQAVRELFRTGIPEARRQWLCDGEPMQRLAELRPFIESHQDLEARQLKFNSGFPTSKHEQQHRCFMQYMRNPQIPRRQPDLLMATASLVYMVRSHIAHGGKAPPDSATAVSPRDRAICDVTSAVLEHFFDLLLDRPSHRLATYGTLKPGEANASMLKDVTGEWSEGTATGVIRQQNGFPAFRGLLTGPPVVVKILASPQLPQHYEQLDQFEGNGYCRVLVPVKFESGSKICNIYQERVPD